MHTFINGILGEITDFALMLGLVWELENDSACVCILTGPRLHHTSRKQRNNLDTYTHPTLDSITSLTIPYHQHNHLTEPTINQNLTHINKNQHLITTVTQMKHLIWRENLMCSNWWSWWSWLGLFNFSVCVCVWSGNQPDFSQIPLPKLPNPNPTFYRIILYL